MPICLTKTISIVTTQEESQPITDALAELMAETNFDLIRKHSTAYWNDIWQTSDIEVVADDSRLQQLIRLNIFHLRQAAQSKANAQLDASVGSRGLTGEGYRGHIFGTNCS
ncbi:Trehalose 6-phosphate phosphorylase [Weissella viridescens]|uniref:Trehalose 6-phosphate phosphorylase n=1 Tax=Weissella viridescens TaxID=1629 RepID=A0A380NZ66_WEIVI|nr:Trehalose 6-phosphate phosphorylase [Weissella viridescens]